MNEKLHGKEQYYEMWYELFKESLKGMNIGRGGNTETSGEKNVLKVLSDKGGYKIYLM